MSGYRANQITKGETSPIFRTAALEYRHQQWLGEVILTGSTQRLRTSIVLVVIAASIIAFLIFGEYTRKQEVPGRVTLNDGPAEIVAPAVGTIVRQLVREGERVKAGQPLIVVSTERTTEAGNSREAMGASLRARRASLEAELMHERSVLDEEYRALKLRVADLKSAIRLLGTQIDTADANYKLTVANSKRFEQLRKDDIVSQAELEQHEREALSQRSELEGLRKQSASSQGELAQLEAELGNAPEKEQNALDELNRQVLGVGEEIVENESNREITIPARIDGVVTSVVSHAGQTVTPGMPLMSLLPRDGRFSVQLYVPSKAIGFMKVGDAVLLRYDAFPYEKFGQYKGVVTEISHTALNPSQLQPFIYTQAESLYRITVKLAVQTVHAYGEEQPLQDGMRVEGDVLIDTRKLYEWVLEPLYALSKR